MNVICINPGAWYLLEDNRHIYLDCRVSAGMADTSRTIEIKNEHIQHPHMKRDLSMDRLIIMPEYNALMTEDLLRTAEHISLNIGPIGPGGHPSETESDVELYRRIRNAITGCNKQINKT